MIDEDEEFSGPEPKASAAILSALDKSEREFRDWQATCHDIDDIYSLHGSGYGGLRAELDSYSWQDSKLDLFWSSYEVMKPAVYARAPIPAVAPAFKDSRRLQNTTAELLERAVHTAFRMTSIDDVMCEVRDDLLFAGRGVPWLRYENDDGQKVCVEHMDRTDFRHEPARKWSEVGWVAGRFWMTKREIRKRFSKTSGDAYQNARFMLRRDDDGETQTKKAGVWEVWHKADNKVYWVTEGVDVLLDSSEPHLKLSGFFPCPRPAYGTLRRRSLVPVPDWERYAIHFNKISTLTARIYLLLDQVRMKGLIPAGGDVGDAVETLISSDDDHILIPVPGAAMLSDGANSFVAWMPLVEIATAIQGLIEARGQLIEDFYQLSGISDIMRGATEAEETLGAQRLKSQYGSVRVRCKIDELQRVAADMVKIAAEIIAENFDADTILEMAQMEIPSKRDIEKRIDEIEAAAEKELKALADKARQSATPDMDPQQAEMALQQAQQQILSKYAPMLSEAQNLVAIEDVMKLLRDDRVRSFTFEVESDSTILVDEMQEKQSRTEFLETFTTASQALMGLAAMGEQGAKLSGELLKFTVAPYRIGRQLDGAIDEFIDAAPQMAEMAKGAEGDNAELIAAQNKLADAEMQKAKAQQMKVEADSQLKQAEMQRKVAEMQQKASEKEAEFKATIEKLRQSAQDSDAKLEKTLAEVDHLRAQTAEILANIGLNVRKQEVSEYQAAEQSEQREIENVRTDMTTEREHEFRERGEARADREAERTENG